MVFCVGRMRWPLRASRSWWPLQALLLTIAAEDLVVCLLVFECDACLERAELRQFVGTLDRPYQRIVF